MANKEDEGGCVTLTWEIQNFSLLLSLEGEKLCISFLKTEHTGKCVWRRLCINEIDSFIYFDVVAAAGFLHLDRCEVSLISSCMEIPLELYYNGPNEMSYSVERAVVIDEKRQSILPNDTLTVRCKMWEKTMRTQEFQINTVLHKFSYLWSIENFRKDASYSEYIEEENFLFEVSMKSEKSSHKFIFHEVSLKDSYVEPLNCKLSVKTGSVNVIEEICDYSYNSIIYEIKICLDSKSLNLQLESVFAVSKVCQVVSSALGDDLLLLYRDKLFSDATLNAEGKSFHVHRNILSARSPVFRAMFEKDEMSEGRSGVVDIDDVDSETVDRMLVFLYGDSFDSVQQFESTSALYYAADKYDIQPLKHKCASVLKEGLTVDNACDVLVLADKHSDDQLLKCIVDFIRQNDEVMSSEKWDSFENNNSLLAAKTLREIYVKKRKK